MYALLNGKEYVKPCSICGLVKVPHCDHRTKADMDRIRKDRLEIKATYNRDCIAAGRPDMCRQ